MLIFVSGYTRSQIINQNGSPFSGHVVPVLKELELFDLVGDINTIEKLSVAEIVASGPGGSPGVMLSAGAEGYQPEPAMFLPERQAWKQVSSAVWIGTAADPVSGDRSPLPEQLERENCVVRSCENVVLADGNIWEVPVIRQVEADSEIIPVELHQANLPSVFYRDVNKQWAMNVVPAYEDLWQQSRRLFEALVEGDAVTYVDAMEFAAAVLGLRYRFNLLIHSRWPDRFLTTTNVISVIRAAVGWNVIERHLDSKKKTQPTSL